MQLRCAYRPALLAAKWDWGSSPAPGSVASILVAASTFAPSGTINLAGATGNIDVRFYTDVSNSDEGFYVDNFKLLGTQTAPVPGPVVGAGLPGLIVACGGLLALARRRKASAQLT
jgi:hypothetical protein